MERRAGGLRSDCHIDAFVEIEPSAARFACVVEDLSESGAKLRFGSHVKLPASFDLLLPIVGKHFHARTVALRWQLGTATGVRFLS